MREGVVLGNAVTSYEKLEYLQNPSNCIDDLALSAPDRLGYHGDFLFWVPRPITPFEPTTTTSSPLSPRSSDAERGEEVLPNDKASPRADSRKQVWFDVNHFRKSFIMDTLTGAKVISQALHDLGVTVIHTLVGIPIADIAEEAIDLGIRVIGYRNEQACSYAASVHGYLTGRPGVCI